MGVTVETKSGTVIRTLAARRFDAGDQSVVWNGLDRARKRVKGGVYRAHSLRRARSGPSSSSGRSPSADRRANERREPPRTSALIPARTVRAMLVASITGSLTRWIGDAGIYAVFGLMLVDAVFPAASEVVMVYGGALAAGAFAGKSVTLFGAHSRTASRRMSRSRSPGRSATCSARSSAGRSATTAGGRCLERRGRWFHLDAGALDRAERWFERWGDWAVLLGRITPVVRSFISIPAGVFRRRSAATPC